MPELAAGLTIAEAVADVATGVALLAAGAVTWTRAQPDGATPGTHRRRRLAGDIASALVYAHRGPLVHTLLTYPSGRTLGADRGRDRVRAYLDGLVPAVARSSWVTIALMATVMGGPRQRGRTPAWA